MKISIAHDMREKRENPENVSVVTVHRFQIL